MIAAAALAVAMLLMLAELQVSMRHERMLRARGAVEPPDAVYSTMRWAYPAVFVAMAVEGMLFGPAPRRVLVTGIAVFAMAKLVKLWAITTLGERWTYKVLVLPGVPLVTSGPYRFVRHPNYVGVVGELVGMALMTGARVAGPLALVFFSWLLMRRIQAEERAHARAKRGQTILP
jgi:methyltransferase